MMEKIWGALNQPGEIKAKRYQTLVKQFIHTFYQPKVLCNAYIESFQAWLRIGNEILQTCAFQRGIIPILAKHLCANMNRAAKDKQLRELMLQTLVFDPHGDNEYLLEEYFGGQMANTDSLLKKFYGPPESHSRMHILRGVASLRNEDQLALQFLLELLPLIGTGTESNGKDDERCYSEWLPSSFEQGPMSFPLQRDQREMIHRLEAILILVHFIPDEQVSWYVIRLLMALCADPSLTSNWYLMWSISYLMSVRSVTMSALWDILALPEQMPRVVASVLRLALMTARCLKGETQVCVYRKLVSYKISWYGRHVATALLPAIFSDISALGMEANSNGKILRHLNSFVLNLPNYSNFPSAESHLWDIYDLKSVVGVLIDFPKEKIPEEISIIQRVDILEVFGKQPYIIPVEGRRGQLEKGGSIKNVPTAPYQPIVTNQLQTKSDSWKYLLGNQARTQLDKRHSIIVVASLLEQLPNLGGVCRTCEIFCVQELCIADMRSIREASLKLSLFTRKTGRRYSK